MSKLKRKLTGSQIIIIGFLTVILLGSFLLMLPIATRSGKVTGFMDALFTATSAVCVTGLVVQDTATYWSEFGQAIILMLIQIGGMGVVTVAVAMFIYSGRSISIKQRSTMQEAISAHKVGGIVKLTGFIVKMSLIFELIGAVVMAPVFCTQFGVFKGLWYAVFHSVSAFCNAGFDLMGIREKYSSLTSFAGHPVINITIMMLIVIGGIGFLTWDDVRTHKWKLRHYPMQTKIILVTTGILIVLPAIYFFMTEFNDLPLNQRFWESMFQSVTPRTAGFNTADYSKMSEQGQAVTIFLMLVGGSPGSTAGGMKTTTLAVIMSTTLTVFFKREHTHFFGRRIGDDVVRNAMAVMTMYIVLFLVGGFVISGVEQLPLLSCLFETASAVGTVGLSLGLTPHLSMISRCILILLMYIGRVGGLTIIFSAISKGPSATRRLPQEKLTVG